MNPYNRFITNDREQPMPDKVVTEVVLVMQKARKSWSRDDYAEETQDEYVAEAVIGHLLKTSRLFLSIGDDELHDTALSGLFDSKTGGFVVPFTSRENAVDCLRIVLNQIKND